MTIQAARCGAIVSSRRRTSVGSGVPVPIGDLAPDAQAPGGWVQIVAEDFNTAVAEPNFLTVYPDIGAYPDTWANSVSSSMYNGGKSISVVNGIIEERIFTDGTGSPRTEAIGPTATLNQLYGRFRHRWRIAAELPGYKVAWLTFPTSGDGLLEGEIDFPEGELISSQDFHGYLHHTGSTVGSDQEVFDSGIPIIGGWHTSEIIWAPDYCEFILDGTSIGTSTTRVPSTTMLWVIQTEGNLSGDPIDPTTTGYVEIDWIAAWSRNP